MFAKKSVLEKYSFGLTLTDFQMGRQKCLILTFKVNFECKNNLHLSDFFQIKNVCLEERLFLF